MNAEESVELEQLMFVEESMDGDEPRVHPAWLPPEAFRSLGARRILLHGEGLLVDTVLNEVSRACARYGGRVWHSPSWDVDVDLVLALRDAAELPNPAVEAARAAGEAALVELGDGGTLGDEGFVLARAGDVTAVLADAPAGLLYGLFQVVRLCAAAFDPARPPERHRPALRRRMLNHWDNVAVHPVMGQVERGYAGGSIFWQDGRPRGDLARVREYGRLLASCGINAISVNNVNVARTEALLLTERLGDVAE
ncbi:alpha-glucuronidase, partial [Micromonospora sp. NPDC047753]